MLVVVDVLIGMHGVNTPVVVIDLKGELGEALEQLVHLRVDALGEEGGAEIPAALKVIERGAVGDDAGNVAGQILCVIGKRGKRPPGGDGKKTAVCYKVVERRAAAHAHRRDILAAFKRALRVDERVVKIAGKQNLMKLTHNSLTEKRFADSILRIEETHQPVKKAFSTS